MSRGLGRVQRAILDRVERFGYAIIAGPELTESEQVARRRAAHRLEELGLIILVARHIEQANRPKLVAYPPDADLDRLKPSEVIGSDGKHYRHWFGKPVDRYNRTLNDDDASD